MLPIVLSILAALVAVFCLVVALQPADFRITRRTTLAAGPASVFAQIDHLRNWSAWSPWAKLDPNARTTFEGPASGPGAVMAWSGNREVGEGRMTILESEPHRRVVLRLEFQRPFVGTNLAEFTLLPEGSQTAVTWDMTGRNGFIGKAVGLLMNCDRMVGGQFEQGFANLRSIVEAPSGRGQTPAASSSAAT